MTEERAGLAANAARAAELEREVAELDDEISAMQQDLREAERVARSEVADLQRVSRGLYALWLRVRGESTAAIAKEHGEAAAAVRILEDVRAALRARVERRDGAVTERKSLGDALERWVATVGADPSGTPLRRLTDELGATEAALALGREIGRDVDRALTTIDGVGSWAPGRERVVQPTPAQLDLSTRIFAAIVEGLDRFDQARGAATPRFTARLHYAELDHALVLYGTTVEVFARSGWPSATSGRRCRRRSWTSTRCGSPCSWSGPGSRARWRVDPGVRSRQEGPCPRSSACPGASTSLLRAAEGMLPAGTTMVTGTIRGIPLYDGDVEAEHGVPPAVQALKEQLAAADALLLVTPEYNNAIPGVLKNAIDWASRPASDIRRVFGGRVVGVIGASAGGGGTGLSQAAWLPVLKALGVVPWFGARIQVSFAGKVFDDEGTLVDETVRTQLERYVAGFAGFVERANG